MNWYYNNTIMFNILYPCSLTFACSRASIIWDYLATQGDHTSQQPVNTFYELPLSYKVKINLD